ncbi:MAG: MerR family transcriptional regulator [Nitrospirae bacterium]|nr:MerR family transcriptional regulator [Nitrospirota bacterium]
MTLETSLGDKTFYKIGEVSELTKLPASVLRFWESEFSFLKPRKSQGRHRVYDRQTIETVLEIKRMLYEEGYTIMGLKRFWNRRRRQGSSPRVESKRIEHIKVELRGIIGLLNSPVTSLR